MKAKVNRVDPIPVAAPPPPPPSNSLAEAEEKRLWQIIAAQNGSVADLKNLAACLVRAGQRLMRLGPFATKEAQENAVHLMRLAIEEAKKLGVNV